MKKLILACLVLSQLTTNAQNYWVTMSANNSQQKPPANASTVSEAKEDGHDMFIARASFTTVLSSKGSPNDGRKVNNQVPGKIRSDWWKASVCEVGKEAWFAPYEVWTGPVSWMTYLPALHDKNGKVTRLDNISLAETAGQESDRSRLLYVALVKYNNEWVPGYFYESDAQTPIAYCSYAGNQVSSNEFKLLTKVGGAPQPQPK